MYVIKLIIIYDVVNLFHEKVQIFEKIEGGSELEHGRELVHHHYTVCSETTLLYLMV